MISVCLFLSYFDGLCHFTEMMSSVLSPIQPLSMGFYQLSRIYYCFAKDQVYSNEGYPNWVFSAMYIVGILWAINLAVFQIASNSIRSECGINGRFEFEAEMIELVPVQTVSLWQITIFVPYFLWDFGTLLLYVFKIRSFGRYRAQSPEIHKRIYFILFRMLIVTVFYETGSDGRFVCILWRIRGHLGDDAAFDLLLCLQLFHAYYD